MEAPSNIILNKVIRLLTEFRTASPGLRQGIYIIVRNLIWSRVATFTSAPNRPPHPGCVRWGSGNVLHARFGVGLSVSDVGVQFPELFLQRNYKKMPPAMAG